MDFDQIKSDIASFADPRTLVKLEARTLHWTQDRTPREATLIPEDDGLDLVYLGKRYSYPQFFASEHMADLRQLAQDLPRYIDDLPGYVSQCYVSPNVTIEDDAPPASGAETVARLCDKDDAWGRTQLLFIRGRAGDGKTALLTQLTRDRAVQYTRGESQRLFFYVDAQGRSLARVDEAIALILQDLRARFTYHALATLTRLGLLIPIIDGFDELLGTGGYRDAFSSLATLLDRLHGLGTVVASARASFYNYTAFSRLARRPSSSDRMSYRLIPVDLQPWGEDQVREYLHLRRAASSAPPPALPQDVNALRAMLGDAADEVLSSPFLVSRAIDIVLDVDESSAARSYDARSIVRMTIGRFVQRELVEKVLDRHGAPALSHEQHLRILAEVAEEMWWQETRELDLATFKMLVEMGCDAANVDAPIAAQVVERLTAHALLALSDRPSRVAFRHELYFAYFLGERLAASVTDKSQLHDFAQRATLTSPIAEEFACALFLERPDDEPVTDVVDAFASLNAEPLKDELLRGNRGALYSALIRRFGPSRVVGARFSDAVFQGENLSRSTLDHVEFHRCLFVNCDVTGCRWTNVVFQDVSADLLRIDSASRLESTGLRVPDNVRSVELVGGDHRAVPTYDPEEVAGVLRDAGATLSSDVTVARSAESRRVAKELHQLLRVLQSTILFSAEDFKNRGYTLEKDLGEAWSLLREHELVRQTKREMQGSRQLYRLLVPAADIGEGEAAPTGIDQVDSLWTAIRAM